MEGFPPELLDRCRTILLDCPQFKSYETLRPIFMIPDLMGFRHHLPDNYTSRGDFVNQTIDYLWWRHTAKQIPVFPLFLKRIQILNKNTDLYTKIAEILPKIEQELSGKVFVAFVIAAMNDSEAKDLLTGELFDTSPNVTIADQERFNALKEILGSNDLKNLITHYDKDRECWKPPSSSNISISQLISTTLENFNQRRSQHIEPIFFSDDLFSEDHSVRRRTCSLLRDSGGILVIDAVSIFHPEFARKLMQAEVGSHKRIAIVVVTPVNPQYYSINQVITEIIETQMVSVFDRFDEELDRLCEVGIGNIRGLRRWFFSVLETTTSVAIEKPSPIRLQQMQDSQPNSPQGIYQIFAGTGGL
ncbi:MAG: hypothetical protein JXA33_10295 [Anaerolineae bacterium]|nr:hypothetical protein [Anaerolineae bacterium]